MRYSQEGDSKPLGLSRSKGDENDYEDAFSTKKIKKMSLIFSVQSFSFEFCRKCLQPA